MEPKAGVVDAAGAPNAGAAAVAPKAGAAPAVALPPKLKEDLAGVEEDPPN